MPRTTLSIPLPSVSSARGSGRDVAGHVLRQLVRGRGARELHDVYDASRPKRTYQRAFREYESIRKRVEEHERRKAEMVRWYQQARRRGAVLVRQVRETAQRIADLYAHFLAFARGLVQQSKFTRPNRMWLARRIREIQAEVTAAPANNATYMPRHLERVDVRYSKTLARAEGHRRLSKAALAFLNHEKEGKRIPHAYVRPDANRRSPDPLRTGRPRVRPPTWDSPVSSFRSPYGSSPTPSPGFSRRSFGRDRDPFMRRPYL